MNHSDDDIFGRNIDQLDRETPRYNLSEEENADSDSIVEKHTKPSSQMKKMSTFSQKSPSVASVPPYSHPPPTQPMNPVMSPHLVKKQMAAPPTDLNRKAPPVSTSYYNKHYQPPSVINYKNQKMPGFHTNSTQAPPPHSHMNMSRPIPGTMPSIQSTAPPQSVPPQPHPLPHPPFMGAHGQVVSEQASMCYCADCMHQQQMNERHKLDDEILMRQRELDSCWQEGEEDCPMDFTAHDRKKENLYAERNDIVQNPDIALRRENKTVANHTSAFPIAVSREHPVSAPPSAPNTNSSYGPTIIKGKQQAVVSPFTRGLSQKRVNINHVVREFSYSDGPEAPQDYTSAGWPQSEMGSRIPSSERINLSPLCMSAVPSGIQTPVEPGTGQKPLPQQQEKDVAPAVSNTPTTHSSSIPSATTLQQLPGHEINNRGNKNILDKFKGNEQYKPAVAVAPTQDSVKDFTSGRWVQSEMGSRIPSSEMISLSPLTMSGIPSGIQTPAEPNTGCIPLSETSISTSKPASSSATSTASGVTSNSTGKHEVDNPIDNEVQIRNESSDDNKNHVILRQKKLPTNVNNNTDGKLPEVMARMNFDGNEVPRFDYIEEDSVKNYGTLEMSSQMQSYENLNFNGPWSTQTSGLVTPCDHGSIYGGVKPLRQQQPVVAVVEDKESLPSDIEIQSKSPCDFGGETENRNLNEEMNVGNKQTSQQHIDVPTSSYGQHTDKTQPASQPHKVTGGPNVNRRRNSCSSQESAASNRTDISTVVNTPMSMHNTAPASPDPNGSEATDSTVSDNEEVTEGTAGYAPKPSDMNSQQQRWHHDSEQPPRAQGGDAPSDSPMSRKGLIQLAKEQFPKKNQPKPSHGGSHPTNQQSHHYHHHQQPPSYHMPHQTHSSSHYSGNHPTHPTPNQGYSHHYSQPYQGYDRMNTIPPSYGYPQNSVRHQQPQSHMFNHHTRYPPHENNDFRHHPTANGRHIPPSMNPRHPISKGLPPGGGYPHGMDGRQGMNVRPAYMTPQQHAPRHPYMASQQATGAQRPSNMMKNQLINDYYVDNGPHNQNQQPPPQQQQQQQVSKQPPSTSVNSQQHEDEVKASTAQTGNRAYSVTSLEPNRASPPHTDTLDTASVVSFASIPASHQNLDTRVDMVSSLLSMLGTHDADDMARTLLAMSNSSESCAAMRQSKCIPLLIQLLHNENKETGEINWDTRRRAGRALHNIIHSSASDRHGKREVRVLRFLEVIREHTDQVMQEEKEAFETGMPLHQLRPEHGTGTAVAAVMKLSFDEEHKITICELGGLQTICELLAVDYRVNKDTNDPATISLRKYVGMVLINLTFNDPNNKAVLCNMPNALKAVIGQLRLTSEEDLVQVFAGITRNISWRPDDRTQQALKAVNAVRALMLCIPNLRSEVCIRSVLSAVWNLSAHNSENKEEICRTPGSLKYLTYALSYRSPSNGLAVIENAGGILRNISSHIAIKSEYRRILRQEGCLQTLVTHLRSPSTRVVSNACGVLWNISARCVEDQEVLWELGAVSVLKTLVKSKHKSISASSAAALRNLLAVKPGSSGTDTESQLSFKHRSNSLPMRGQYRIRGDKKYRSISGATARNEAMRMKIKPGKTEHHLSQDEENAADMSFQYFCNEMYGRYPQMHRDRTVNEIRSPIMEEGVHNPPSYQTKSGSTPKLYPLHKREDSLNSETAPSQYFFPADSGRLPLSAPINRRKIQRDCESSSSCSSFSPNDGVRPVSAPRNHPDTTFDSRNDKKSVPSEENNKRCSPVSSPTALEMKPYDDCKLSVAKDVVMIYQGTPKMPLKASKATKDGKQKLMKLTSKIKRQKQSVDSLSSRDSVAEKSDIEKKKPDIPRDHFRAKTKVFKHRFLNKSHSSDLSFNTNSIIPTKKKSPFDIYSMSNFPDRVASDQCLTMTDRYLRDNMADIHPPDMYHGSWSSCDVTQCRDERIYPNGHIQEPFIPSPKLRPRMGQMINGQHVSYQMHTYLHDNHTNHGQKSVASNHSSRARMTSASVEAMTKLNIHSTGNESTTESERKSSKSKKSILLKNPLKKKNKKKAEE